MTTKGHVDTEAVLQEAAQFTRALVNLPVTQQQTVAQLAREVETRLARLHDATKGPDDEAGSTERSDVPK